ncbi:MAG: cytochrome c biogenesis protein CcsA, partial [Thermodesulfobacteriota bacterium]
MALKPLLYVSLIFYVSALAIVGAYHLTRKSSFEGSSRLFLSAGFFVHTIALAVRTYQTGHAPMASVYETLLFFSWSTVLVSIVVIFRYNERLTELVTVPTAMLALVFSFFNEVEGRPLVLILRTRWFETHVISSFAAYSLFTLAFSGAVLYLIYDFRNSGREELGPGREELMKSFQDIA